jgi:hypothetical protein
MSILTLSDLETYAPSLANLDEAITNQTLASVGMLVQSFQGSRRPLDKQSFQETRPVHDNRVLVSRMPLQLTPSAPIVEVRNQINDAVVDEIGWREWRVIDPSQYEVDTNAGEIRFKFAYDIGAGNNTDFGRRRQDRHTLRRGKLKNEVRITYYTGFDFSTSTPPQDVIDLKYAMGAIAELQYSQKTALSSGNAVVDVEVKDEYRQKWQSSTNVAVLPGTNGATGAAAYLDQLMTVFRKYRPRESRV